MLVGHAMFKTLQGKIKAEGLENYFTYGEWSVHVNPRVATEKSRVNGSGASVRLVFGFNRHTNKNKSFDRCSAAIAALKKIRAKNRERAHPDFNTECADFRSMTHLDKAAIGMHFPTEETVFAVNNIDNNLVHSKISDIGYIFKVPETWFETVAVSML